MVKNKKQTEEINEPRSVVLMRLQSDPAGQDIMQRRYQPYEGAQWGTIMELAESLEDLPYDILVLHDSRDECLMVVLSEGKPPEVGKLACKIHHKE